MTTILITLNADAGGVHIDTEAKSFGNVPNKEVNEAQTIVALIEKHYKQNGAELRYSTEYIKEQKL
jgi:hypothetical protein